jgi:REP element-mobilizing transposase RayT
MAHTYSAQFIHVVFSTKARKNLIPTALQTMLGNYIAGIAQKLGFRVLAAGGISNHLHLLIALKPAIPLSVAVQKLKSNSSRWISQHGISFEWQSGYGAFSVSPSLLPTVAAYIANQEQHHRRRSFEDEFLTLLRKSGLSFDQDDALD